MSRIESSKRILTSDFPEKYKDVVEPLAFVLNPFMEQVTFAVNGQLDFSNIRVLEKDLPITVDHNGIPVGVTSIKNTTGQRIKGILCIYAQNTFNTDINVESTPFVNFEENAGLITIRQISGLVKTNNITSIAVSNPAQITSPNHGLKTGQKIRVFGTNTSGTLVGSSLQVTVTGTDTFTVPVNVTSVTTGTGFFKTTENKYSLKILAFT